MQISAWDADLRNLSIAVNALEAKINEAQRHEQKSLLHKKSAVIRYQMSIEKVTQKMQALQKKKFALPHKASAIIYWCAELAEKSFSLYQRRSRILGQKMWFQLVQARLHGSLGASGSMIENNDLVDMAVREGNLKKTMNFLSDRLIKSKIKLDNLTQRHQTVVTMQANAQAANSLQTHFGRSLEEALDNPRYLALTTYVKWLTASVRGTTEEEAKIQTLRARIAEKTDVVVGACRDIILEDQGVSKPGRGGTALDRLQKNLREIDALQAEIQGITQKIIDKRPPEPSPKLMKKTSKQATKGPLESI